jgi:hypothetical protein
MDKLESGFYLITTERPDPFSLSRDTKIVRTDFVTIEKSRKNTYVTVEHDIGGGFGCSLAEYKERLRLCKANIVKIES